MHAFETLGDLIDILKQTLFNENKKEYLAISIIKVRLFLRDFSEFS